MARDDDRSTDERVDELLRSALEPNSRAAQRIVATALAGGAEPGAGAVRRRARWPLRVLPAAAVVLIIGVAAGTTLWQRNPTPAPAPRGTISNQGDIIVVTAPGRPVTLIGSSSTAPPAPHGTASIVLLGEPQ